MGGWRCEAHLQVGWMLDFSGAGTWCCVALRATSLLGSNDRSLTGGEANLAGAQRSDQNKLLHTRRVGGLQDGEGEAGRGRCELWAVRVLLRQGPQPAAGLAGSSSSASSKLGQRSTGHSVHIAQHSAHSTAQRTSTRRVAPSPSMRRGADRSPISLSAAPTAQTTCMAET